MSASIAQLRALRAAGHSIREIAALTGCKAIGWLHEQVQDIPPPNGGKWRRGRRRDLSKRARIRRLHEAGLSMGAIAERVHTSKSLVHRVVHEVL
jgi:AraC-like DNA-binding protein